MVLSQNQLGVFILIYFVVYFSVAFVLKSLIVAKRIGKNPLVLPNDDSAYGLVGFYFKVTLTLLFVYVLGYAVFPDYQFYLLSIAGLNSVWIMTSGIVLLIVALVWTVLAQAHMKDSWRIGIDTETKTRLVTTGLFSVSRNPIFLGMIISLLGLFLVTPNALTALFLILGYVLIQIQIRLEEEFLLQQHGPEYKAYKQKVRRLI